MTQPEAKRGRPRLLVAVLVVAVVIAVVDQLAKLYAIERLTPGVIVPILGDYLGWQLIYNPGAAFSMATGMTWVLTIVAVVVVIVTLRVARRLRSTAWAIALGLLLGGAVGNLIDRLVREPGFGQGHVVDFINYNGWFVGNIADIAIVGAALGIAVLALVGIEVDGSRVSSAKATPGEAGESADSPADPAAVLRDDDSLLSEQPLEDEDEAAPLVPEADVDDVDLAEWVNEGRAAREAQTYPEDLVARSSAASPVEAEPTDTADATGAAVAGEPADDTVASEPDDDATHSEPDDDVEASGADEAAADGEPDDAAADEDAARPSAGEPGPPVAPREPTGAAAPAATPPAPRRWRSRREMRAATEGRTDDE